MKYKRGENPKSRNGFKQTYEINHKFFDKPNLLNSYYGGWLAADGNITKDNKYLAIGLSSKDKCLLDNFLSDSKSNYKYTSYFHKKIHESLNLKIRSDKICKSLSKNFNITPAKSLTLLPPNLKDERLIDSFIVGYIDGDGSIGLYKSKRQQYIQISIIGTLEVLQWIQDRFSRILGQHLNCIHKQDNIYILSLVDKRARNIFIHYYGIKVPKLDRKWGKDKYNHCINYKKFINIDKYKDVLKYTKLGLSTKEISKLMSISIFSVYWHRSSSIYKKLEHETKMLDKDTVDIESEETVI